MQKSEIELAWAAGFYDGEGYVGKLSKKDRKREQAKKLFIEFDSQGFANRRKTHCPRGHEYNEENSYITKQGYPHCRICRRKPWRK